MTILQDDFLNNKLLNRVEKDLINIQLEKTIFQIDNLNKIQQKVLSKPGFTLSQNKELNLIKKLNNARKKIQA